MLSRPRSPVYSTAGTVPICARPTDGPAYTHTAPLAPTTRQRPSGRKQQSLGLARPEVITSVSTTKPVGTTCAPAADASTQGIQRRGEIRIAGSLPGSTGLGVGGAPLYFRERRAEKGPEAARGARSP